MNKLLWGTPQYHLFLLTVCIIAVGLEGETICPVQSQPTRTISPKRLHIVPDNPIPNSSNPEFASEKLTALIERPGLPTFSGKTHFIYGINFPNAKGGASSTMKFATTASEQEALDWYRQAFKQSGWMLSEGATSTVRVGAMKGKQICNVMVMRPARSRYPGDDESYRADVVLRYKF